MTLNDLIRQAQAIVNQCSSGDIPLMYYEDEVPAWIDLWFEDGLVWIDIYSKCSQLPGTKVPFNLNQYKIDFCNVKVYTSFGEQVQIVKTDCKGKYPILAVIDDGDTSDAAFYTEDGKGMNDPENNYLYMLYE